jgi:hypothetical protein
LVDAKRRCTKSGRTGSRASAQLFASARRVTTTSVKSRRSEFGAPCGLRLLHDGGGDAAADADAVAAAVAANGDGAACSAAVDRVPQRDGSEDAPSEDQPLLGSFRPKLALVSPSFQLTICSRSAPKGTHTRGGQR